MTALDAIVAGTDSAEPLSQPRWTVLAEPGETTRDEPAMRLRRVVAPVAAAAVLVAVLVGLGGWLVGRHIAEQQGVHDVAQLTNVLAQDVVQPALTDAMADNPAVARRGLDPVVRRHVLDPALVRVKLWAPDGRVLYSDQPQLIGQRFTLEPEARDALESARIEAGISDLRRPENRFERAEGKLLEVYRPVWTPGGSPLLFETYFRYNSVTQRSHQLWRAFGGVLISSLLALLLLMVPLVRVLFVRARRARTRQEALTQRALHASDEERRRVAATLHDGVVQQLAAASFTTAGIAERAAASGQHRLAADLDMTAATVRNGLAGLRSLLVGIYPPSLHSSGLAAALRDLAHTSGSQELAVTTRMDDDVADSLPQAAQEAAFGVAQEALRNAGRHADASQVTVSVRAGSEEQVLLEIADDGRGFDVADALAAGRTGHFGMQLMADVARRGGGRLSVASAPGRGTAVRLELASA